MVNTADFYKHVKVEFNGLEETRPLGKRLSRLLDEVVQRLPDEEQFKLHGHIEFCTRETFIEKCEGLIHEIGNVGGLQMNMNDVKRAMILWQQNVEPVDVAMGIIQPDPDGHCMVFPTFSKKTGDTNGSFYDMSLIADLYEHRPDVYIRGVIAHELAEMSHKMIALRENIDSLRKMKPKALNVMFQKITKTGMQAGSDEYKEHEKMVNREAIRLGFKKEMESDSSFHL